MQLSYFLRQYYHKNIKCQIFKISFFITRMRIETPGDISSEGYVFCPHRTCFIVLPTGIISYAVFIYNISSCPINCYHKNIQYTPVLHERINIRTWISNIEYFLCVYTFNLQTVYFFKFNLLKMNCPNLLSKNTAICERFLTHMAVFSSVWRLSYRNNFFIPVGCFGWCRQNIHLLSAATFAELSATFPKIVAAIFFFLLPTI